MPEQINVFIIYAREDREIKQGLLRHLNPLKDSYNLNIWHDDHIEPGQEWKPSIESRLEKTDLFLLLISADFMNSEFIHQVEFKFAIDRHKQNKSVVIPVIINYCLWDIDIRYKDDTFNLKDLQALPDEGKPIGEWKSAEQAYNNIAGGIRKVLATIREKRGQAESAEAEKKEADKRREENIRQKKLKKEREESLQRQIAEQKEKEKQGNARNVKGERGPGKKGAGKNILYSLLIVVSVLAYFMFQKPDKKISGEDGGTSLITRDTSSSNDPEIITHTGIHKIGPNGRRYIPGSSSAEYRRSADGPISSFNTFPNALAAAFTDAPNNFANFKGMFIGNDSGMKKYKTRLLLRDKAFRPLLLFQNGNVSKFVFANENSSNYESIKSAIEILLKKKGIKYEYESSASVGFERYTWNNKAFEIYLSIRKYTDNFVQVDFYHRDWMLDP